jgi:hypothetical protein
MILASSSSSSQSEEDLEESNYEEPTNPKDQYEGTYYNKDQDMSSEQDEASFEIEIQPIV